MTATDIAEYRADLERLAAELLVERILHGLQVEPALRINWRLVKTDSSPVGR
jgi:hypothetical protein